MASENQAYGLDIDPASISRPDRYKLVCGLVIPRPIALVTTLSSSGVINAAPFSFFNIFSEEPPVVALGLNSNANGSVKDTTRNIRDSGEFVVHLVSDEIAEQMCLCAIDFPEDISEVGIAKFRLVASRSVAPPTILDAPVALECKLLSITALSPTRDLALGQIVRVKSHAGIVDTERWRVNISAHRPVGRLMGNSYVRMGEVFEMKRLTYQEWRDRNDQVA